MQTLSNGVKKPQDGDRGSTFFDALSDNAQAQNDHTHNGTDAEQIASKYVTRGSVAVTNVGWVASDNLFRKSVTMPAGYTWPAVVRCYLTDGTEIFPALEKITSTTFYIYMPYDDVAVNVVVT